MVAARNSDLDAAIALTRFGLGAQPGEIAAAAHDPRGYLAAQIAASGAEQPVAAPGDKLHSTTELFALDRQAIELRRTHIVRNRKEGRRMRTDLYETELLARARLGIRTRAGFRERWTLFWCNHFSTERKRPQTGAIVGSFEREAIRPHAFGRFADLLLASTRHPTMLLYLDQARSVGPNSRVGERGNKGLNENLAREVMELHTLGVDAGYTQADVTEMARALTGWTTGHGDGPGIYSFQDNMHEPGTRHIFGKTYAQEGEAQATAALLDFAASPHTATHVATKLAHHFVADDPPQPLIAKLAGAYRDSGGALDHVARTLVAAPECWEPPAQKFKAPYEFLISAWRAAGAAPRRFGEIGHPLRDLGQNILYPNSPKGWDDSAANWAAAAAIMERVKWSNAFSQRFTPSGDPVANAKSVLGARLTTASATAIGRAETRNEAFALLLMTPEFQRR